MKDGFEKREALLREQESIVNRINNLSRKLDELKLLYDQYFIGLERTEPLKLREEVKELIKTLSNTYIKSTAQKFKLKALINRHASYSKLWDRILREIEEGKYKRDIFRMKVKDWQSDKRGKDKEKKPKAGKDPIDILYERYLDSRKKTRESVNNISKEAFSKTVTAQMKQIKTKFKCKTVTFKIIVDNGKTKLKALPKK